MLESIFEMVREITRESEFYRISHESHRGSCSVKEQKVVKFEDFPGSISSLVKDVTDALGINTEDGGIGGIIGGALNLLSVGAGMFSSITSH